MMPHRTVSPVGSPVGSLRLICQRIAIGAAALIAVAASFNGTAVAAEPKPLGTFNDWSAFTYDEAGKKVCYVSSQPKSSEPKKAKRGVMYVLITHRPGENIADTVSAVVGYPLRKGSEMTLEVDGKPFALFTDNETGWARDAATDKAIVQALRSGTKMVVKGTSQRGTKTADTYSLSGSSAALDKINEACGVKG